MVKYNPRVDYVFMKLFANKNNKNLLMDFINSTVFEEDKINDLELKFEYKSTGFKADNTYVLTAVGNGVNGRNYNFAIQVLGQGLSDRSSLFQWSRAYANGFEESQDLETLNKTICINILNNNYLDEKKLHNIYRVKNVETNRELGNHMEVHFIELEKFKDKVSTMLDRWVHLLVNGQRIGDLPDNMDMDPAIQEAYEQLGKIKLTKSEEAVYAEKSQALVDEEKILKKLQERSLHEGEKKKAIEIAKNLLDVLDIRTIADKTGLPVGDIINMKRNRI